MMPYDLSALLAAIVLIAAENGGEMSWPEIYQLINTVGLPIVILGIVVAALWRAAVWAEKSIVTPALEGFLKFLEAISTRTAEHSELLEEIRRSSDKRVEIDERLCTIMAEQKAIMLEQINVLKMAIETQTRAFLSYREETETTKAHNKSGGAFGNR